MPHQPVGQAGGWRLLGGVTGGGFRFSGFAIERMAPTAARATSVSFRSRAIRAMMLRNGVIRMAVPPAVLSGKEYFDDGEDKIEYNF
ncbi:MAG: hypothetical protein LUD46_05820 [Parabacteroides sp.]|nr:hypothetical protein [Parabacteroides sp.]